MEEKIIKVHRVVIETMVYDNGEVKINTQERDVTEEYIQCDTSIQTVSGAINLTASFFSHYVLSIAKKSPLCQALSDINTVTVVFGKDKYVCSVDCMGGRLTGLSRLIKNHREKIMCGKQFLATYNKGANELTLKLL